MSDQQQAHWAKTQERGSLWGIMFLFYVFKFLGARICKVFMSPVLLYFYLFNAAARKHLLQYLQRLNACYADMPAASQWHVLRLFFNFGFGVVDRMSAWQGHVNKFKITKVNDQAFLGLRKAQQGAVIMISHLGNFEISRMASAANKGAVFNVFMHTKNARKFSQVIKKFDPDYALSVIQGDALTMPLAIELKEKVEAGEFVVIAGDRIPVNNQSAVVGADFLGAEAAFPIGPYVLAKVLGCPLLTLFCIKQQGGYRVSFEQLAAKVEFSKQNRNEVLAGCAQQYAHLIETQLKLAPLQWYNFHDFWSNE